MREWRTRIEAEEELAALKYQSELEQCKNQVRSLQPRIKTLLETANEAINCGIKMFNGDEGPNFISEGITHKVGLYPYGKRAVIEYWSINEFKFLGIRNGGANGSIDFVTDGESVYGLDMSSNRVVDPQIDDMRKFVDMFDDFEQVVYSYIDKIIL